jgi:uncharacterized protein YutD
MAQLTILEKQLCTFSTNQPICFQKKMGEMLQLSNTKTHLANIIKSTTNIEKLKEKYSSITQMVKQQLGCC